MVCGNLWTSGARGDDYWAVSQLIAKSPRWASSELEGVVKCGECMKWVERARVRRLLSWQQLSG